MTTTKLEEQAKAVADVYREGDPAITKILWFPNDEEMRILLISPDIATSVHDSEVIQPFYFGPAQIDGTTLATAIAYIAPSEVEQVHLPEGWGEWSDGVAL